VNPSFLDDFTFCLNVCFHLGKRRHLYGVCHVCPGIHPNVSKFGILCMIFFLICILKEFVNLKKRISVLVSLVCLVHKNNIIYE
jgi:hypothetical protein